MMGAITGPITFFHDPFFSDLNRITNVTGLIFTNELAVRVTLFYIVRTLYSEQDF